MNQIKNHKSMRYSRFTQVLFLLFTSLSIVGGLKGQTIDTTINSCICTGGLAIDLDNVDQRVGDVISWTSASAADWRIVSYSGYVLPDSILYHAADPFGPEGDEFFLSTDIPELDTISGTLVGGNYEFVFSSFRRPSVAFQEVIFTNGPDTLNVTLESCSAAQDGIMGGLNTPGVDTVCLNDGEVTYQLANFDASMIDMIEWSIAGDNLPTGSGSMMSTMNTFDVDWTTAGDFTVSVIGTTNNSCPIEAEIDVYVIDTDFSISGPDFACSMDSTIYSIDAAALSQHLLGDFWCVWKFCWRVCKY